MKLRNISTEPLALDEDRICNPGQTIELFETDQFLEWVRDGHAVLEGVRLHSDLPKLQTLKE